MNNQTAQIGLPILLGVAVGVATGGAGAGAGAAIAAGGLAASTSGAVLAAKTQADAIDVEQGQSDVAAKEQQRAIDMATRAEQTAAQQRATAIQRQLMATLGEQEATLASRGVRIGGGTAQDLANDTERAFADDLRINRLNAIQAAADSAFGGRQIRIGQDWGRQQSSAARQAAIGQGVTSAVGQVASGAQDYYATRGYKATPRTDLRPLIRNRGY